MAQLERERVRILPPRGQGERGRRERHPHFGVRQEDQVLVQVSWSRGHGGVRPTSRAHAIGLRKRQPGGGVTGVRVGKGSRKHGGLGAAACRGVCDAGRGKFVREYC